MSIIHKRARSFLGLDKKTSAKSLEEAFRAAGQGMQERFGTQGLAGLMPQEWGGIIDALDAAAQSGNLQAELEVNRYEGVSADRVQPRMLYEMAERLHLPDARSLVYGASKKTAQEQIEGGVQIDEAEARRLVAEHGGYGDVRVYGLIAPGQSHPSFPDADVGGQMSAIKSEHDLNKYDYETFWAKSTSDTLNQMIRPASKTAAASNCEWCGEPVGDQRVVFDEQEFHLECFEAWKVYPVNVPYPTASRKQAAKWYVHVNAVRPDGTKDTFYTESFDTEAEALEYLDEVQGSDEMNVDGPASVWEAELQGPIASRQAKNPQSGHGETSQDYPEPGDEDDKPMWPWEIGEVDEGEEADTHEGARKTAVERMEHVDILVDGQVVGRGIVVNQLESVTRVATEADLHGHPIDFWTAGTGERYVDVPNDSERVKLQSSSFYGGSRKRAYNQGDEVIVVTEDGAQEPAIVTQDSGGDQVEIAPLDSEPDEMPVLVNRDQVKQATRTINVWAQNGAQANSPRVHTTYVTYNGELWVAQCDSCDWTVLAAAERHAEEEGAIHEDDAWHGRGIFTAQREAGAIWEEDPDRWSYAYGVFPFGGSKPVSPEFSSMEQASAWLTEQGLDPGFYMVDQFAVRTYSKEAREVEDPPQKEVGDETDVEAWPLELPEGDSEDPETGQDAADVAGTQYPTARKQAAWPTEPLTEQALINFAHEKDVPYSFNQDGTAQLLLPPDKKGDRNDIAYELGDRFKNVWDGPGTGVMPKEQGAVITVTVASRSTASRRQEFARRVQANLGTVRSDGSATKRRETFARRVQSGLSRLDRSDQR